MTPKRQPPGTGSEVRKHRKEGAQGKEAALQKLTAKRKLAAQRNEAAQRKEALQQRLTAQRNDAAQRKEAAQQKLAASQREAAPRLTLAKDLVKRYTSGESIRVLAASTGRSYSFVHRLLTEAGVQLRKRGLVRGKTSVSGGGTTKARSESQGLTHTADLVRKLAAEISEISGHGPAGEIVALASEIWPPSVVVVWFRSPNSFLDGLRPLEVLANETGGATRVFDALRAERAGVYSDARL